MVHTENLVNLHLNFTESQKIPSLASSIINLWKADKQYIAWTRYDPAKSNEKPMLLLIASTPLPTH